MRILFTKSANIGSWLIRDVLKEPVSHCALTDGIRVLHSTFNGVQLVDYSDFVQAHEVCFEVDLGDSLISILALYTKYLGHHYDYGAFAYIGLRYLIPALPKANLWQTTGMFLCTELVTEVVDGQEDSLITPYQLYLRLLTRKASK